MKERSFSYRLLAWSKAHGRKELPWQLNPTPYRVWVSEIMLQQTQVGTVIPYFERFMERFPTIEVLASAPLDAVLQHWSGLGYYARGRNLHKAATLIVEQHAGCFPEQIEQVIALPGIGRSTAGAILSIACGQRHPILDGNVKRVLCRYCVVEGWPGQAAVERKLWRLADHYTPSMATAAYTQAIMDLGATLCRRSKPLCSECPVAQGCQALKQGRQALLPERRPKKALPTRHTTMLILRNAEQQILLQQRPPSGIWGGLWSLPEFATEVDPVEQSRERLGLDIEPIEIWPMLRHTFSHFHLEITPLLASLRGELPAVRDEVAMVWQTMESDELPMGIAAPVAQLLQRFAAQR